MTDYEGRYERNGEDLDNYGGGSSPPRGGSHGGLDDPSESKSQVTSLLVIIDVYYSFILAYFIFRLLF